MSKKVYKVTRGASVSNQAFILNVGVNQAHRLRSPIYPDGRFEFVPIPETHIEGDKQSGRVSAITYGQLRAFNTGLPLLELFPKKVRETHFQRAVHYDPNLANPMDGSLARFSYGDVPRVNIRSRNLLKAGPGDLLIFIANLAPYDREGFRFSNAPRGFYVIAAMEIGRVLEYPSRDHVLVDIQAGEAIDLQHWATNAHVNRLLRRPSRYSDEPFTIFTPGARARRFLRAAAISRQLCDECLRDKFGRPFDYSKFRSLNACIGAYTRTVRAHFDLGQPADQVRFRRFSEMVGTEFAEFADLQGDYKRQGVTVNSGVSSTPGRARRNQS